MSRQHDDSEYMQDGQLRRRPLWDVPGGPEHQVRRAHRCRSYLSASPLQLDHRGRAETRLTFPNSTGKGAARTDAARGIATRFGVEDRTVYHVRRSVGVDQVVRDPRTITIHGPADDVARYLAALPRVLDYAESIATIAARSYGAWSRRPAAAHHFEYMDDAGRRATARQYRAAAFRVIVDVLIGPQDVQLPEPVTGVPPWKQVEAIAGGYAQYGWVDITEAYDPATARELLAQARQWDLGDATYAAQAAALVRAQTRRAEALFAALDAPPAPAPTAAPRGERPARAAATPATPVVIIPCSGAKLDHPAEAGRIYTGPLHKLARQAAYTLTADGGTVLVLSALHGFLPLAKVIDPYDHTWEDEGSITVNQLRDQAAEMDLTDTHDVVLLTPGKYTRRAAAVWPHARTPLAHLGIGRQLGRLAALRDRPELYTPAA